jgi:tetratricopeptide (TPR) repeat protein
MLVEASCACDSCAMRHDNEACRGKARRLHKKTAGMKIKQPAPGPKMGRSAADTRIERASWALRTGHPDEAERLAAAVLRADRANSAAAIILGQILLEQARFEEAVAALRQPARRSEDPRLETLLAIALGKTGHREEAIKQLEQATRRQPPFAPAFREHANQLSIQGEQDEAIAVLECGLLALPDTVELMLDLALLYLRRNARHQASRLLERAAMLAPNRPDVLAARARALVLDGAYDEAAKHYQRALSLRPDDAMSRANLAVCLLEMGERDQGEMKLREAVRGRPDMIGRAIHSLAAPGHGRFFLRPSAVIDFLNRPTDLR